MIWFKLVPLSVSCFIAFVSIIIRLGWKHLFKCIPKLPSNKKWSIYLISCGQIIPFVTVFFSVNLWVWINSSEDGSDFRKMSNTVRAFESQIAITKHNLSSTGFASFEKTMEAVPEVMEEMKWMIDTAKKFDVNALDGFLAWLKKGECSVSEMETLRDAGKLMKMAIDGTIEYNIEIERIDFWTVIKSKIKTETVEYANYHDPIQKQLTSTIDFLDNIVQQFNESKGIFRNKMIELTYEKNYETKKFYILPSVIVVLFSLFSICTIFNEQLRLSRFGRYTVSILFYAVSIQVIVLVILEFNSDSVCHLNPQQFLLYKFQIPLFEKSSIAITEDVFSKCVSTKNHIFSVSNNGMIIPKSSFINYFENMRNRFRPVVEDFMLQINNLEIFLKSLKDGFNGQVVIVNQLKDSCIQIKNYQDTFQTISNSWNGYYEHGLIVNNISWGNSAHKESLVNRNFEKLYNVFDNPIKKYNVRKLMEVTKRVPKFQHIINTTFLDCGSMFNAYKHGYDRSCFIINEEVIEMLKMVVIVCSSLCSVIHLLNLRRLEVNMEHQGYQPLPTV